MRNPHLVLQNEAHDREANTASNTRGVAASWPKQSQRVLTAQETDLLLSGSLWSRRDRRALVDNHSVDFHPFRIF